MLIDPSRLLPDPQVTGTVAAVRVEGYSKNAADGSVRGYLPDLNDLPGK